MWGEYWGGRVSVAGLKVFGDVRTGPRGIGPGDERPIYSTDGGLRRVDQGESRIGSFSFAPERRFRCLITMFPNVAAASDFPVR